MKHSTLKFLIISIFTFLMYSCGSEDHTDILIDENFKTNKLRWVEENTKFHSLEISGGKYHIDAKDTVRQTSTAPYNRTYLYDLKENFSVTFKMDLLGRDINVQSRAGIILNCASVDYRIFISNQNKIIVTEEQYLDTKELVLLSKSTDTDLTNSPQKITVIVNGYKGSVIYDEKKLGEFTLQSKAIEGIRIFTSAQTSIDIYNLKVQNNVINL